MSIYGIGYLGNHMDRLKLLLVENSRTARAFMGSLLTESGFEITAVASGPEAQSHLTQNKVDVVIMDVFMPVMNGYEVTKLIRDSKEPYADVPIIAYTASQHERDKILCLKSGMNDFIIKSEENTELINWLNNFQKQKAQPH